MIEEQTEEVSEETTEETLPEETEEVEEEVESEETEEALEEGSDKTEENEIPEGYIKEERFNNMMSKYQDILEENRTLKNKPTEEKTPKESQEDVYLDYLTKKLSEKQVTARRQKEDAAIAELDKVISSPEFSKLSKDDILKTATKYGTNLSTAAQILKDSSSNLEKGKKINEIESKRKAKAGVAGGKPSASGKGGLTGYDPKLSLEENWEKGLDELGMK